MKSNKTALIAPILEIGIEEKVLSCVCFHNRPLTGEGGGYAHALILILLTFFVPQDLYLTVRNSGSLKVGQICLRNYYFQFIHMI